MDVHEDEEAGDADGYAGYFPERQPFFEEELGQNGHPHGHGVVQHGDDAGCQRIHADLHADIVDGNLQDARSGDPLPVLPFRDGNTAPGTDREHDGGADEEAEGHEQDGREISIGRLHDDPVETPDGI
mgnify:FL=1